MTLISLIAAIWNRLEERRRNVRAFRELSALSPAQLRDIGVRLEAGRIVSLRDEEAAEIEESNVVIIPPLEDSR